MRSRARPPLFARLQHHPVRHHLYSPRVNACVVLTLVWVLVLRWGLNTGDNTSPSSQASSNPSLKSLPSLEELYGPQWDGMWPAGPAAGPSQLLVLSYYQTKASLLARLLMLMGVFAGEAAQLRIGTHTHPRNSAGPQQLTKRGVDSACCSPAPCRCSQPAALVGAAPADHPQ
jgi:hypothetical protein